jgi:hypothetical protein
MMLPVMVLLLEYSTMSGYPKVRLLFFTVISDEFRIQIGSVNWLMQKFVIVTLALLNTLMPVAVSPMV